MLPQIPPWQYPAQALCVELYLAAGIRGVEIGSVIIGRPRPDGTEEPAALELVRLAFPRRVYTRSHVDYVAEALTHVADYAAQLRGMVITSQALTLRPFNAHFQRL